MPEPKNAPPFPVTNPTTLLSSPPHVIQIDMDVPARLLLSAQCSIPFLSDEIKQKITPLLSYETMAVVAGSVSVLIASHSVGIGFAADVVLGIATVAVLGAETVEAGKRLHKFYDLALAAKYKQDFDKAGREFACFITIIGINVALVSLTKVKVGNLPKLKPLDSNIVSTGWATLIDRLSLKVPRDQGILWSKIGMRGAERIAQSKGLTSLEMLLKREGFYELYAKQFGSFDNVAASGLDKVTAEIWRKVSCRYVANLEGKVTAFVSQKQVGSALTKGNEPILVDELWEIAEAMQVNSKISSVQMIDVSSGRTWIMQREQVMKAMRTVH
jgi:hypothetical protein